ncbi:MAG: Mov34/MPN/PAD-1 family protein [Vulcanimicrobiota bacterium]
MTLRLTSAQMAEIEAHARSTYPEECGGLLLGLARQNVRTVFSILPLTNQRADSRHNRVELSPLDYARGEKEAARLGLGVWGFYHSHPDHPAVPSDFDLEHAGFVDWSYLITPVHQGRAAPSRSWILREDRTAFEEEAIEMLDQMED